jgi:hypothetical protein
MENLNPSLALLLALKFGLEKGATPKMAAKEFLREPSGELGNIVAQWIAAREAGRDPDFLLQQVRSPYRQALLRLMDRGFLGDTIYPTVLQLEGEVQAAVKSEMDAYISALPIKMLIPLLLLQFPAFLILLFGPLLTDLLHSF